MGTSNPESSLHIADMITNHNSGHTVIIHSDNIDSTVFFLEKAEEQNNPTVVANGDYAGALQY